jgi:hypothetical protein
MMAPVAAVPAREEAFQVAVGSPPESLQIEVVNLLA